jgi:hypothetical protein
VNKYEDYECDLNSATEKKGIDGSTGGLHEMLTLCAHKCFSQHVWYPATGIHTVKIDLQEC